VYPVFGHRLEEQKDIWGLWVLYFGALAIVGQSSDRLARAPFAQGTREDEGIILLAYSNEGLDDEQRL